VPCNMWAHAVVPALVLGLALPPLNPSLTHPARLACLPACLPACLLVIPKTTAAQSPNGIVCFHPPVAVVYEYSLAFMGPYRCAQGSRVQG
jgi:hypothetical protein